MELLAPAGNADKLRYAYQYGADAAYIGIDGFSLRAQADNFPLDSAAELREIKGSKKLYGAFNIYCKDSDISRLELEIDTIATFPFDALIISDIGLLPIIRTHMPNIELHLSTQANCLNSSAAALYRDMGFTRIIPGRELSLVEIAAIKKNVPDLEIEVFVHGAMCLAYSGRCFLSSWMTGRSANQGDCAHSCRWKYQVQAQARSGELVLQEEQRPGEYFPLFEGDGFTSILSSKDLCMIDHLGQLSDAGVDSIKIEGRMKSVYYLSMVTRAYRRELDRVEGNPGGVENTKPWIDELYKVSHRQFSTGFFFGETEIAMPATRAYEASHLFIGTLERERQPDPELRELAGLDEFDGPANNRGWRRFALEIKNPLRQGEEIEVTGPMLLSSRLTDYFLVDQCGRIIQQAFPGRYFELYTSQPFNSGFILRKTLSRAIPMT